MAGVTFTDNSFNEQVLKSPLPVLIDFWAEWCPPCKMIGPMIDELAEDYKGRVVIGKMNADENPDVVSQYTVMSLPTILLFKNGQPVTSLVGAKSKETYKEQLEKLLSQ